MSHEKEQVKKFYEIIWNQHDKGAIPDIIHESLIFRGSLDREKTGYSGFSEYLDEVHSALDDYRCDILELVAEQSKAFARMRFSGVHVGEFMGYPPTNSKVEWEGAALFHFREGKISGVWVLGDLKSLEGQLYRHQPQRDAQ